jgi:hypothetical protein
VPADRSSRFAPPVTQDELVRGYQKAGGRAPFTKQDVQKAYEPYGLKIGGRKSASDTQLYHTAAKAVVDLYRKQQAEKKRQQAAAQKPPAPPAQAPASARIAAPATRSPSSGGRRYFDDAYVSRAMRTVGLYGVAPSAIPNEYRRSYASLVAYLSQIKAQRALATSKNIGSVPKTTSTFGGGGIKLIR